MSTSHGGIYRDADWWGNGSRQGGSRRNPGYSWQLSGWVKQTVILVGLRSLVKRASTDEAWNNHLSVCEPHHNDVRP